MKNADDLLNEKDEISKEILNDYENKRIVAEQIEKESQLMYDLRTQMNESRRRMSQLKASYSAVNDLIRTKNMKKEMISDKYWQHKG